MDALEIPGTELISWYFGFGHKQGFGIHEKNRPEKRRIYPDGTQHISRNS